MEILEMMQEDNEKAMSVLAENMNSMMVPEIRYEFEGKEYVFRLSDESVFKGKEDKKDTLCSIKMPPVSDEIKESWKQYKNRKQQEVFEEISAKQAFEDFISAGAKVTEIAEDMKAQVMNDMSEFVCNVCHDTFYCMSYKPICDKCKLKQS